MGRAVEHQAEHRQCPLAQGLQAEQGVVEGAQAAAGHQQHGQPPALQLLDLQPVAAQGHQHPAGGLHHQGPCPCGQLKALGLDRHPIQFGGPVGREGPAEPVGLRQQAIGGLRQQPRQAAAVAPTLEAALHGLPVVGAQPLHQPGAHHRLAHIGVGAAHHQPGGLGFCA